MAEIAVPPTDTLAPWAECVPDVGPMSVSGLLDYRGEDGWRYELVEGVLIRVAGSRPKANRLYRALGDFVEAGRLGHTTPPDGVYDFERTGQPNTGLLPDIGFYHAFREALVEDDQPYPFAPDLAVEVASPSQKQADLDAKARRYLRGGTALVWVIWPDRRAVDVWHPGETQRPSTTLGIEDLLDGADTVPGFSYPIARLFA